MFGIFFESFSEFVEFEKFNSDSKCSKKAKILKSVVTKVTLIMKHYFDCIYWEEYKDSVKSFSSRVHIRICQNTPTPSTKILKTWICSRETLFIAKLYNFSNFYSIEIRRVCNSAHFCILMHVYQTVTSELGLENKLEMIKSLFFWNFMYLIFNKK